MTSNYPAMTALELRRAIADRMLTAESVVRAAIDRITEREARVHAWEILDADGALAAARAIDRHGATGALAGVPLGVKDIIATADLPTRYGSSIYAGFRPSADAGCVARARAADAIVMGKTVTTELAYFSPGPTANPRNLAHTPGGSSSGSAAAVADGMVPIAFGTQTAGSLIRPASFCGVFALKPTFDATAMDGIKPFAPSLDTLGWLARSADDLELMRCALAGTPFAALPVPAARTLRLGVCRTHQWDAADGGGAAAFERALQRAAAAGARLRDVEPPVAAAALFEAQKTVMAYEAVRQLEPEWRDHRAQLSAPLSALLDGGRGIADAAYRQALDRAADGRRILAESMRDLDALITPAAVGEAPLGLETTGDPVFSRVWTLLGVPCVGVPGLLGPQGLPIGVQLVGHPHRDRDLLALAGTLHEVWRDDGSTAVRSTGAR